MTISGSGLVDGCRGGGDHPRDRGATIQEAQGCRQTGRPAVHVLPHGEVGPRHGDQRCQEDGEESQCLRQRRVQVRGGDQPSVIS